MKPFNDAMQVLRVHLGEANAKLVNRLSKVSGPKPTLGTPDEFRRRNTSAYFQATGFSGSAKLCYDRIVLQDFLGRDGHSVITREKPAKIHDAIPLINRKYLLELKPEDVNDGDITWDPDSKKGVFILEANPDSVVIAGRVAFELVPGPDLISELQLNGDLGFALYPSGNSTKGQAQFLSFPRDTSAHNGELSAWRTGEPIDATKLEIIRSITDLDWVMADGDYSLNGAELTYAGVVRPGIDIPKAGFQRIVTIKLGDQCTNFAGELTFYHNPN